MCPRLCTRLHWVPLVEGGKLLHLEYEVFQFFSYLPFEHIYFSQPMLHWGGGGLAMLCGAVPLAHHTGHRRIAFPYDVVWVLAQRQGVSAGVGFPCLKTFDQLRVHPSAPGTTHARRPVVLEGLTLQFRQVDPPTVAYGAFLLPLLDPPGG